MDVGATLRRARQEKRLTLDQLSRTTRISHSNLHALENNDFDRLPATVYTRGFLRTFAREVGLDPEDTVAQYTEQLEEARRLAEPEVMSAERSSPVSHSPQPHDVAASSPMPLHIQIDLKSLPRPAIAAAAVVLLAALIAVFAWRSGDDTETTTAQAAQSTAIPASGETEPVDAARATHVMDDVLRLELKTTGLCWVSASADRAFGFARLLHAGEAETIEARDEVVIRVGDPSTITLTLNGVPLRPLGRAGIPVTVQINRQNYRDYLAE